MAAPVIELQDVTKVYRSPFSTQRVEALSHVSFVVEAGEICAFLGPNGAGKTTTINLLMGLHRADSGQIRVLGCPPDDVKARMRIGFLPESFAFYRYLTAAKLMHLHRTLAGNTAAAARVPELLAQVRLQSYGKLKIGKYSRGMLQRLGLAQALLGDPQLLILDEPTSGLDPAGRQEVLELLKSLRGEGRTVFLSSHILPEVEPICDRVVVLDRGRVVRTARLDELVVSGERVEILASWISPAVERLATALAAVVERASTGVRVVVDTAHRQEFTTALRSTGCEILSIMPARASAQEDCLGSTQQEARA
jgi:ABC-2 type transport system ATP-binding protein